MIQRFIIPEKKIHGLRMQSSWPQDGELHCCCYDLCAGEKLERRQLRTSVGAAKRGRCGGGERTVEAAESRDCWTIAAVEDLLLQSSVLSESTSAAPTERPAEAMPMNGARSSCAAVDTIRSPQQQSTTHTN